jgi:hypothetical protein
MKLIPRHRHHRRRPLRIAITEEEIAADLHYPASRRPDRAATSARTRGMGR